MNWPEAFAITGVAMVIAFLIYVICRCEGWRAGILACGNSSGRKQGRKAGTVA